MPESVSDAGHGPSRGYSGMNAKLDNYLKNHPAHAAESESRSRSLGPRASDFHKKSTPAPKPEVEAAMGLLAYLEIARQRIDMAIATVKEGLAVYRA